VVLKNVLEPLAGKELAVHVVWAPVLGSDNFEAGQRAHTLLPDPRVKFYWDGDKDLGLAYGETVELPRGRELAWDIYFAFAPDVVWNESVPEPTHWAHQLGQDDRRLGDGRPLRAAVETLLGNPTP